MTIKEVIEALLNLAEETGLDAVVHYEDPEYGAIEITNVDFESSSDRIVVVW